MQYQVKYKVVLSEDALNDIKNFKKYILLQFKYQEYAENFSKKIKQAVRDLEYFPKMHARIGCTQQGNTVYYYVVDTYIIVFVVEGDVVYVIRVLKENMYWQSTLKRMHKIKI